MSGISYFISAQDLENPAAKKRRRREEKKKQTKACM
jgi:hypothetical protein